MCDTAVLGHVGTTYLTSASLSDLVTTSTFFLANDGVLGTFVGQAYGAGNFDLAGIWLQVSLVIVLSFSVPVLVAWNLVGPVLRRFGYHGKTLRDAALYSHILSISILPRIGFQQMSGYLQAMKIVTPAVVVSLVALAFNLVANVFVVLGVGIPGFDGVGFLGCPIVTTTAVVIQATLLYFVYFQCKQVHAKTWPGFQRRFITTTRIKNYLKLYLPSILQTGSEFWRFNVIGALAASLGDDEVAAFNSSYKVIYLVHQFVIALGIGTGIRVGIHLGAGKAARARDSTRIGMCLAAMVSAPLSAVVYIFPTFFARIFSSDQTVIDLYASISLELALTIVFMTLSDVMENILTAQGRALAVVISSSIVSWGVHVPATILLLRYWRHDMRGLYLGVALGYVVLTIICAALLILSDWNRLVIEAGERSEVIKTPPDAADTGTNINSGSAEDAEDDDTTPLLASQRYSSAGKRLDDNSD